MAKVHIKLALIITLLMASIFIISPVQAKHDDYPKLANYYLKWDINSEDEIKALARWDFVILAPQAEERNPGLVKKLRNYNPEIVILAYVPIQEIGTASATLEANNTWKKFYDTAQNNNWWLRDGAGQIVSYWPTNQMINVNTPWKDYLPGYIKDTFYSSQLNYDGVFFDNCFDNFSFIRKTKGIAADFDRDGLADDDNKADNLWRTNVSYIINKTRALSPTKLVVVNANSNYYNNLLNGRMMENFPQANEGSWADNEKKYLNNNLGYSPKYFIVNRTTYNVGLATDYASMRFGLTSTLLGDGYFSFDTGDWSHTNTWWYDEYEVYLGNSLGIIRNVLDNTTEIKTGVYRRDFQNGIVLVNSTASAQTIKLNGEYEAIKGTQDTLTNNGAVLRTVTIKPNDGIILKKRIEMIYGNSFNNGSFVRAFNTSGQSMRNGFFLYDHKFFGSEFLGKADLNNDGKIETINADKSKITVFDEKFTVLANFYPYGDKYNKGINFALADLDNDKQIEIITGTNRGGGPQVKTFKWTGQEIGKGFFAYAATFRGGVNVAAGDTNGDGTIEIITGAGYYGGPLVRIFDKNGKVLSGGFFAYAKTFRGGVNVACGDVNGDGKAEIITGAGIGGSSHVRVFDSKFRVLGSFFAFDKTSRDGVQVYLSDLDNNGIKEILATTPNSLNLVFSNR